MYALDLKGLLRDAENARLCRSRDANCIFLEARNHRIASVCYAVMLASTAFAVSTYSEKVVTCFRLSERTLWVLRWGGASFALAGLAVALKIRGRAMEDARAARSIQAPKILEEPVHPVCSPEIVEVMKVDPVSLLRFFEEALLHVFKRSYPVSRASWYEVDSMPSESVVRKFIKHSSECRLYLNGLLLFMESEGYGVWQKENTASPLDRQELLQMARELEMAVAHFARNLKRDGYTFARHSLDEFFHPKKLVEAGAWIESDLPAAMQVWGDFQRSQLRFYYLELREPTELIQRFSQIEGQRAIKSARE